MKKILIPFQKIGTDFLTPRPHAMIGDEMGLGKTVQALAAVDALGLKRVGVVCPASVRSGWKQEIEECLGSAALSRFHIDSYNAAVDQKFPTGVYDAVILDECHFLKNLDSQRTQAIFGNENGLARRARIKWCLTGTPVLNRPRELYPVMKALAGKSIEPYTTFASFTQRFCGAYFDGRGINTKGATHMDDLAARLKGFMLRRTKAEVMPELPPRIIQHPPLDISKEEMAGVFEVENEIMNREAHLSPTMEDFSQLGDTSRLLQATGLAKVKAVVEFVEDLLETEKKVVIFARHREVIKLLDEGLAHCMPVIYHGGMNDAKKKAQVAEFVGDESCEVFIGQIQAAGTGINGLQNVCSNVVFAELSWVPGEIAQAIDRCHRIGQTADAVNVFLLHVPGTLESAMLQVQLRKQAVIDRLVGVRVPAAGAEENLLDGLI